MNQSQGICSDEEHKPPLEFKKKAFTAKKWLMPVTITALLLVVILILWIAQATNKDIPMEMYDMSQKEVFVLSEDSFDFTF